MQYSSTTPCWQGWPSREFNEGGRCCCNCRNQQPIVSHPWNTGFGKGSILNVIGYGCVTPELFPSITFMGVDKQHCMCECWVERDWQQDLDDCITKNVDADGK